MIDEDLDSNPLIFHQQTTQYLYQANVVNFKAITSYVTARINV